MDKILYFFLNIVAIFFALFFISSLNIFLVIIGIFILLSVANEIYSGKYKKYVKKTSPGEYKKLMKLVLPFLLLFLLILTMLVFVA